MDSNQNLPLPPEPEEVLEADPFADQAEPFADQAELDAEQLVIEVLARNPSLAAMQSAWRAAAQRYPQAVSLDDPMLGFMVGPGAWANDDVDGGYTIELSQKLPWAGKRELRGRAARAEASVARFEIGEERLRLAAAARQALYDYYLADAQQALNVENLRAVGEFREAADARYRTNQVTQQDVLQADVELAQLERRGVEIERARRVAVARINTLLHRRPDHPLPPPPKRLSAPVAVPPCDLLEELAVERRPDLAARAARIRQEQANVALAWREFYPDFEVVARYDAFWQEDPLRAMVGMNLNLPVNKRKRLAAVREAAFRSAQRGAELAQQIDAVHYDVRQACEMVEESRRTIDLFDSKLLPASRQNVESARAGYTAGQIDFLRLVEAQRQRIMFLEQRFQAEAEYHRRLAELQRFVGGILPHEQ